MRLLVTGGAGFIGSNFVKYMSDKYPDYLLINLDVLTYAGNKKNIKDLDGRKNYHFVCGDICDKAVVAEILGKYKITHIVNFAAETHVDRSIEESDVFFKTNVMGTKNLLNQSLKYGNLELFYHVSTDEVYGALDLDSKNQFTEKTPLNPQNPYSASKAAADLLVLSYVNTFNTPAIISRCSNNYGPNQYPEKIIPLFVNRLVKGEKVPVYGDGLHIRDWIHVEDHVRAVDLLLHKGKTGEIYNIGGDGEISNLELTHRLLSLMNLDEKMIEFVKDRKGHDRRYSMSYDKMEREFGWKPKISFEDGLKKTVDHYITSKVIPD